MFGIRLITDRQSRAAGYRPVADAIRRGSEHVLLTRTYAGLLPGLFRG
jgi:hypothetical protein